MDSSKSCAQWAAPGNASPGEIPISDPRHGTRGSSRWWAFRLLVAATVAACTGSPSTTTRPLPPGLELVGQLELATGTVVDGVRLGGLSALVWDPSENLYHALADDPGEHGPPRLYQLRLSFAGPAPRAELVGWQPLTGAAGTPYREGAADPEAMALMTDGSLLIASEGLTNRGVDPFLRRFSTAGRELGEVALPERYLPSSGAGRGVRNSLGFESLTVTADGGRIYLATEGPLGQDGAAADLEVAARARLLMLSWPAAKPLAEHAYPIEPLRLLPQPPDAFRVAGLVELLAVDRGRLLALERQFAVGAGFSVRLYAIGLEEASDLRQVDSLAVLPGVREVCKELLVDFADLGIEPRNLEGLSWGPILADGRRTLIVVEDSDFGGGPAARFLQLAPRGPSATSWLALARRCW